MKGKVVSIDLKTLAQTYLCSIYNSSLNIGNGVVCCEKCDNALIAEPVQIKKRSGGCDAFIEKIFNLPISKTPKKNTVMELMNKTFSFTLNKAYKFFNISN